MAAKCDVVSHRASAAEEREEANAGVQLAFSFLSPGSQPWNGITPTDGLLYSDYTVVV